MQLSLKRNATRGLLAKPTELRYRTRDPRPDMPCMTRRSGCRLSTMSRSGEGGDQARCRAVSTYRIVNDVKDLLFSIKTSSQARTHRSARGLRYKGRPLLSCVTIWLVMTFLARAASRFDEGESRAARIGAGNRRRIPFHHHFLGNLTMLRFMMRALLLGLALSISTVSAQRSTTAAGAVGAAVPARSRAA